MTPGIHRDIPARQYHSLGAAPQASPANAIISKSLLWRFFPNPAKWRDSPPFKPGKAMRWGSLVDCLALTPERFDDEYAVFEPPATTFHMELVEAIRGGERLSESPYDEFRTKEAKEWKKAQEALGRRVVKEKDLQPAMDHALILGKGMEVVSPSDHRKGLVAADLLRNHPVSGMVIETAEKQVACVVSFNEPTTGVLLKTKCLLDLVDFDSRSIWDLKTTGKPIKSKNSLEKHIYEFGYHAQLAWYSCVLEVLTGETWDDYHLIFQESEPPYYTTPPIPVDPDAVHEGRRWIMKALRRWVECAVGGEWDSFDPAGDMGMVGIPRWAYSD